MRRRRRTSQRLIKLAAKHPALAPWGFRLLRSLRHRLPSPRDLPPQALLHLVNVFPFYEYDGIILVKNLYRYVSPGSQQVVDKDHNI